MRKTPLLFALSLLVHSLLFAQQRTVTGQVNGTDGVPIPSATVAIKGQPTSTLTDDNGHFKIIIPAGSVLTVSSVGFVTLDVNPGNKTLLTIVLSSNVKGLTGVVVTALGIVRQQKALGYATAEIRSKDLTQAKPISVANGLTGKVAGLQVNTVNNGLFAPTRVTLRGNRSLTGNNQPLTILDGAIFYNDISTLNPDDIESISILKGASAAAIYGSDASNGVMIINTKRGSTNKPVINFSSTVQRESVSYLPSLQNQFGSNGGESFPQDLNDLTYYIPYENQSYGPLYGGQLLPLGRPVGDGTILMVPYSPVKNQKKDFFDKAITTQNNASYSIGDANGRFFISAQDIHSNGVMPKDHGIRDVVRTGASKTYGIFSADFSFAYTNKYTNTTNTGTAYNDLIVTPAHVPLSALKDWQHNKFADPSGYFNEFNNNPYFDIDNYRNKVNENDLAAQLQMSLKPFSWLNISYRISVNNSNTRTDNTSGQYNYNTHAQTSDTVIYSNYDGSRLDTALESTKFNAAFPFQASYQTITNANFLLTSDLLATVTHDIGKDFKISATLGESYIDNQIHTVSVNAGPLFFPVYNLSSLTGIPTLSQSNREAKKAGYFVDASLSYKGFAFIHGAYRTDVDSRLSSSNRYIPYYDIDGSLVVSDRIPSLADSKVLDYLKIRAAHSLTGNSSALSGGSPYIADGAYATVPTLNSAIGFPFNGLGGYLLNPVIANPGIKPEIVTENEIGVELGFLKNRISLTTNLYEQRLKDGIVYAQIDRASGFTAALINAASTQTRGIETELKATLIKSNTISWVVGVNYTHTSSKVLSINGQVQSIQVGTNNPNAYAVVNHSYPVIEASDWSRDPKGRVIVDPVTGDPTVDPNLKILGNASPSDILGITTHFSWKSVTISATMDYRTGYKVFNSLGQALDFGGISSTSAVAGRERFVFPNSVIDEGNGNYVKNTSVTTDDGGYNFWTGTYLNVGSNYVTSAAAFKLREASISYDFPKSWYGHTRVFQDISFTLSGRNLLMLRPKTNLWTDPEFSEDTGNGVGRNSFNQGPPTRIFSATLAFRL